jgi:poly(hydroxyalkanoate) granule-associated protein
MANRDESSSGRQRTRKKKQAGGRASAGARPGDRARRADDDRRTAQQELLQGVQQVWLAGMGAIARAQKDGPAAFSDAAYEGLRLLNTSRSVAQKMVRGALENAQGSLQSRVGDARGQAQETWDNLEALFQSRVQRAMHQLGVPTAEEIRQLTRRVAELNANVERINARERVRKTAAAKQRSAPARGRRRPARRTSTTE